MPYPIDSSFISKSFISKNVSKSAAASKNESTSCKQNQRRYQKRKPASLMPLVFCSFFLLCTSFISQASADQNAAELPELFSALKAAGSASQARQVESEIWLKWLDTQNDKTADLLQRVLDSMSAGELDDALSASTEIIESDPEFAEGWNKRATVYYLMGRYDESVRDIHRTLQLEPRHFGAISGLGLIFLRTGDLPAALDAFRKVLDISPQSANARRSVAQVESELDDKI